MNREYSSLAGNINSRKLIARSSISSDNGLLLADIVNGGLALSEFNFKKNLTDPEQSLAERVFQALIDAKIWTANVAMHFSVSDRNRYFRQLDLLHDCDEWLDGQSPVLLESYKGFIRFMLLVKGNSKPSLALTPKGHMLATWQSSRDRLSIIFLSGLTAEWVISQNYAGTVERGAGTGTLDRVIDHIAPFEPSKWLINA